MRFPIAALAFADSAAVIGGAKAYLTAYSLINQARKYQEGIYGPD
jgi:hypothetical protein